MSDASMSKKERQAQYNETRKRKREASKKSNFHLEINVCNGDDDRLTKIKERLQSVKDVLCINGKTSKTQNADTIEALLLAFETLHNTSPGSQTTTESTVNSTPTINVRSVEVHTPSNEDDQIFACTYNAFSSLICSLVQCKSCCSCSKQWDLSSQNFTRYGHAICFAMNCYQGHVFKWYSSPILNGKYYVNCRMIHAFLSCGILETQYKGFSKAALMGFVEETAIRRVFYDMGYFEVVSVKAKESMKTALVEEKSTPFCEANNGVAIMSDSRHDSVGNAYNSTITGIGFETKKVLHVVNISRTEISSAQTREFHGTTQLIEELQSSVHGIEVKVVEVGHDFTVQVKKWLEAKGIKNSFDTWHGTKSVKKAISKIAKGPQRQEGVTWFSELSDKVASIKTGFYYAMRTNNGTQEDLQKRLLQIVNHYQGDHEECDPDSPCKEPCHVSSKLPLTDANAIDALRKTIMSTQIYKYAADYVRCRDTFMIEAFHNVILVYAPKRNHFGNDMFNCRVNLAVIDWNLNVMRDCYSMKHYQSVKRPNKTAPTRLLMKKDLTFRDEIWSAFFVKNK